MIPKSSHSLIDILSTTCMHKLCKEILLTFRYYIFVKYIFKITDETLTYSPIFSVTQTIPNAYKKNVLISIQSRPFFATEST